MILSPMNPSNIVVFLKGDLLQMSLGLEVVLDFVFTKVDGLSFEGAPFCHACLILVYMYYLQRVYNCSYLIVWGIEYDSLSCVCAQVTSLVRACAQVLFLAHACV